MNEKTLVCSKLLSRISAQMDCIRKLTGNKYADIVGTDRTSELNLMLKRISALKDKLESDICYVSIVGLEKAGKSTFANAFMGIDILPTKEARCTYTSTKICYGNTDLAEVKFFTKKEFNDNFFKKLEQAGIETSSFPDDWYEWNNDIMQKAFSDLSSRNNDSKTKDRIRYDIEEILENRASIYKHLGKPMTEFKDDSFEIEVAGFIASPSKALSVKEITIYSSKLSAMKNVQLYDVPGFDSPTQIHKDQTKEWMKRSDAIIFILNASVPSFNESIKNFFETIDKDDDGIAIGEKLFVFGNRADMSNSLSENINQIFSDIHKYNVMPDDLANKRFVAGSAKLHIDINKCSNDEKLKQMRGILSERNIEPDGGIDKMRRLLIDYNNNERMTVMNQRADNVKKQLDDLLNQIKSENTCVETSNIDLEIDNLVDELKRNSKEKILANISDYERTVTSKCNDEKPITEKIKDEVINRIEPSKYSIKDEEIYAEQNKQLSTGVDMSVLETAVRQSKYKRMYDEFIDNVVNLAVDEYKDSECMLIKAFEDGLELSRSNNNYDMLHDAVIDYVRKICKSTAPEGYYSSLIRRYSGNLFEVLIAAPFSSEARRSKFYDERKYFYSLSLFDSQDNEVIIPSEKPMHFQILFHEQIESDKIRGGFDRLLIMAEKKIHEIIPAQTELYELIVIYAESHGEKAEADFRILLTEIEDVKIENDNGLPLFSINPNPAREKLTGFLKENSMSSETYSRHISKFTVESYKRAFLTYSKDLKKVKDEFETDICILKNILNNQVMNATSIEIPFLDLVHQNVTSIKESLDRTDFSSFINSHKNELLDEKFKELIRIKEHRQARAEILNEIENIVKETDNDG